MEQAEKEITTVKISSADLSHLEIVLKNAYGEKLYSMKTIAASDGFRNKYDFSRLENGTYWYSVKMDKEITTSKMQIENGNFEVMGIGKSIEPTLIQKFKVLKMSYINPKSEAAKLYVFDSSNKL